MNDRALTTAPPQGAMALTSDDQLAFIADAVRTFAGVQQLAKVIADMDSSPAHLKGKPADCFRVVVQAVKWRMDPFAVAECTALVHGRLCYEGKLVAAVLRSMGAIVGRLEHEIEGKGQDARITITGLPKGAKKPASISGSVKDWRTIGKDKNGNRIDNAWDKQPETMLVYRGTRQWARLFAPEAVLGVYTPDEFEDAQEAEGVVVHREPTPARTGAAEQQAPADPAAAAPQEPAKPAAAPVPPAVLAARDLYRLVEKASKGQGKVITARLCALHGVAEPKDVPADRMEAFGKDVAELIKEPVDIARIEDVLATWEQAAREGEAKP